MCLLGWIEDELETNARVLGACFADGADNGYLGHGPRTDGWTALDERASSGRNEFSLDVPEQTVPAYMADNTPWWERTSLDQNRTTSTTVWKPSKASRVSVFPTAWRSMQNILQTGSHESQRGRRH